MLELKDIAYAVKDEPTGKKQNILKDVNLRFDDGTISVITGPNGSGKSTLIKILMGFEKPTSGKILFNGEDITGISVTERAKKRLYHCLSAARKVQGHNRKEIARALVRQEAGYRRDVRVPFFRRALCPQLYRPRR